MSNADTGLGGIDLNALGDGLGSDSDEDSEDGKSGAHADADSAIYCKNLDIAQAGELSRLLLYWNDKQVLQLQNVNRIRRRRSTSALSKATSANPSSIRTRSATTAARRRETPKIATSSTRPMGITATAAVT